MDTETVERCRFKAQMTAATYVAHGLDRAAEERFELHFMECPECLDEVEAWRAIKKYMPRTPSAAQASAAATARTSAPALWRLAASVVGVALLGAAAGWYGQKLASPDLASTAFFNAPALERGAECTTLKFGADTRAIALRVAGVPSDQQVLARSLTGSELPAGAVRARRQSDGSWLVQFTPQQLSRGALKLEARGPAGPAQNLGCFSGPAAP
jgi:hypothetical protein